MTKAIAFINPRLSTENVGDIFIENSIKRILTFDPRRSVEIDPRKPITQEHLDQINSCDAAVILGTNLWYRDMPKPGRWQFSMSQLRQIHIPIIPFGVGTTRHPGEDNHFEPDTLEQLRYIHASCTRASARDLRTAEALEDAGIHNVELTGCPTLFRELKPNWELHLKTDCKKMTVTVRKGQRANIKMLLKLLHRMGYETVIAAQQKPDNSFRPKLPWWGNQTQVLYQYDLEPYLEQVSTSVGAIGGRLHGNMLHLAHGNPAFFFANCSRALSFCETFAVPHIECPDHHVLEEETIQSCIEAMLSPESYNEIPARYAYYRDRLIDFLDANGLGHRLGAKSTTAEKEIPSERKIA